jgi:hypothetical protein
MSRAVVSRRYVLAMASVLCALAGSLLFASAPALAATEYAKVSSFPTAGGPWGLAVDQATEEVFGADGFTSVQRFVPVNRADPSEGYTPGMPLNKTFLAALRVAVGNSGDVYVPDLEADTVYKFEAASGNETGSFATPPLSEPDGVAVDPINGYVYVSDAAEAVVDIYEPSGTFSKKQFSVGSEPGALAFNSLGDLYVVAEEKVAEYDAAGNPVDQTAGPRAGTNIVDEGANAVAVDPVTNEVYVHQTVSASVAVFESSGEPLSSLEFPVEYSLGLAVDDSSGAVLVSEINNATVSVYQLVTLPNVVIEEASDVTATTATLHGTINPDSETLAASYQFHCSNGVSYPTSAASVGTGMDGGVGAEPPPIPVTANVTGLTPGTSYDCNLIGTNTGSSRHSEGAGAALTTLGEPVVASESFSEVGATTATVSARINAGGTPTEYQFEYGTSASYGSVTPLASLGDADAEVEVHAQLSGLQPGTIYHFRVLARSALGGRPGSDATFTTFPTTSLLALPDSRLDEMVTPVDNDNANVDVPGGIQAAEPNDIQRADFLPSQASSDGDAVAYVGEADSAGSGSVNGNQYLATRAPAGGWTQVNLQPPGYLSPEYQGFSSDLSVGVLNGRAAGGEDATLPPLAAGAPGGGYNVLYVCTVAQGACTGPTAPENPFRPLFTKTPPNRPPESGAEPDPAFRAFRFLYSEDQLGFAGASADFSHLLFEANDDLLAGAGKLETELDEDVKQEVAEGEDGNDLYDSVAGRLSLVNVLPDGSVAPHATFGSVQPGYPNPAISSLPDFGHVISADGSRVFWTDLEPGADMEHVYVRESDEKTIAVSEGPARFWTATPDGRYAYYTEGEELWRFDVEGETREVIAGAGAGVQGVIGVNEEGEDGAYLYFVANGVLAANATPGDCDPPKRELTETCNLYLRHDGVTTFIATLSEADDFSGGFGLSGTSSGDWQPGLGDRSAELTPGGQSLVFESRRSLTGYVAKETEGHQMSEVFVYDAEINRIFCASCDPSGEAPPQTHPSAAAYLPLSTSATYMPRWISDDGSRVFFDSVEPLSPRDSNGRQDVYEWERYEPDSSTESCTNTAGESASENLQKQEKGCIFLLSGGTSSDSSYLLDASASGNDVFFVSRARLTGQDQNDNFNLFDVRVGGVQPLASTACSGTGCQGVPPAPPIFATPSSMTFNGVGNFAPPSPPAAKPNTKPLTRAQKLANALRACRKKAKNKRAACEKQARKSYGPKSKARKSAKGEKRHV